MLKQEAIQAMEAFTSLAKAEFDHFVDNAADQEYIDAAQLILDAQAKGGRVHITGIGKLYRHADVFPPWHGSGARFLRTACRGRRCHLHFKQRGNGGNENDSYRYQAQWLQSDWNHRKPHILARQGKRCAPVRRCAAGGRPAQPRAARIDPCRDICPPAVERSSPGQPRP